MPWGYLETAYTRNKLTNNLIKKIKKQQKTKKGEKKASNQPLKDIEIFKNTNVFVSSPSDSEESPKDSDRTNKHFYNYVL